MFEDVFNLQGAFFFFFYVYINIYNLREKKAPIFHDTIYGKRRSEEPLVTLL